MSTLKEKLNFARGEYERSCKWRSTGSAGKAGVGYDKNWQRWIDLYAGYHYDVASGTDQLVVNKIFSTLNVMGPAVAINNPRFVVNARRPEQVSQALLTEEVLNYLWRKHDFQVEFRLAVQDWLTIGHGWIKVGYKLTREKPKEAKADAVGTQQTNQDSATTDLADEGIDDREPGAEGNHTETEMIVKEDRPFIERISPFDVFVDPDARHPKEIRWIAQRTWRALADVHVDDRYSETQRRRVGASRRSRFEKAERQASGPAEAEEGAIKYAEIIEFYDVKRNTVGTFATTAEDGKDAEGDPESGWLIKPKTIPYAHGHPYVMLRNHEVPDTFYPVGDVEQIESLQGELNETRTSMFNHRKKFRPGYVYDVTRIDDDGQRAMQSDEPYVAIPVSGEGPPGDAIAALPATITPVDFYTQSDVITDDINEVSGVSDYARGQPQQSIRRTATEAGMIADAQNIRAQDRLMLVEQCMAELGSRVIGLMQQYLSTEQVARVVTIPARAWLKYDKDYIAGEFDFEVRGGSTEPQNESFRRQSAMQLADISIPFVEMGVADPAALYMKLLRDGFGEKDPQRFILQQGPEGEMGMGGMPPEEPNPMEMGPEEVAMMMAQEAGVRPDQVPVEQLMMEAPPAPM